ncbi:hypothetical protein B0H14DRAFT_3595706, partial [Mycena olivaceomarginata]
VFPHQGFPHHCALWGRTLPNPLPVDRAYFGPPRSLPWVGPIVDTMFAESVCEQCLMCQGFLLPVKEFSEDYTPDWSGWWPPPIMCLHRDASTEEGLVKHRFQQLFPFCPLHPNRVAQTPKFQGENLLLNTRLACVWATFFIRTWVEAGMTAAAAS